jgi:hypothetical protein
MEIYRILRKRPGDQTKPASHSISEYARLNL